MWKNWIPKTFNKLLPLRAGLMTKSHNNVARIVAHEVEANNRKEIIKSTTGQYIHWNQEIRLPDNINDPRRAPDALKEEVMPRKPDIWYYTDRKNVSANVMKLHLVEITLSWGRC
jgi:hypothetical protein